MPSPLQLIAQAAKAALCNDVLPPEPPAWAGMTREEVHRFGFELPFQAVCDDLRLIEDGGLYTAKGLEDATGLVVVNLIKRLRVLDYVKQHPEVLQIPLPPILYIAGFVRSSSTLLHNLMTQSHPKAQMLERWQLTTPAPPLSPEERPVDRIAKMQKGIDAWAKANPVFAAAHKVNADEPEENMMGMIDPCVIGGVSSFAATAPKWTKLCFYSDEVSQRVWKASFINFRVVLQVILSKRPRDAMAPLVLKCPISSHFLAEFMQVFPESTSFILVRDPQRVADSANAMIMEVISRFSDPSRVKIMYDPRLNVQSGSKFVELRSRPDVKPVLYNNVMKNPVDVVDQMWEFFCMLHPEVERPSRAHISVCVTAYLQKQKRLAPAASYPRVMVAPNWKESMRVWGLEGFCRTFGIEEEIVRVKATATESSLKATL